MMSLLDTLTQKIPIFISIRHYDETRRIKFQVLVGRKNEGIKKI